MVSSNAPAALAPLSDDVLARGRLSAVSRMAFDMDAVSPFLRASTILNLRTDCSKLPVLVSWTGEAFAFAAVWLLEGVLLRTADGVDSRDTWLRGATDFGGDAWLPVVDNRPSSDPDSSSRVSLRRNSDSAAADLDRLWLLL